MNRIGVLSLVLGAMAALGQVNELVNPSLEPDADGNLPGWIFHVDRDRCGFDTTDALDGKTSMVAEYVKGSRPFALLQNIVYEKPDKTPILYSGWSKAENVISGTDYCIYLDIDYEDGTHKWAVRENWEEGTHGWQQIQGAFWPDKPVKRIQFFILMRHSAYGKAWFDKFELYRKNPDVHIGRVTMQSLRPVSENGLLVEWNFLHRGVSSHTTLLDQDGGELASIDTTSPNVYWPVYLDKPAKTLRIVATKGELTRTMDFPVFSKPSKTVNTVKSGYRIWTEDSMVNAGPMTYPGEDALSSVELELAKAEAESGQILLTTSASTSLRKVSVRLPDLRDANGDAFKGTLKWERVGYVLRRRPHAYHPLSIPDDQMWLPDPLLPARDFEVVPNSTQGIWLTARADRDAKAGIYKGDVQLDVDGKLVSVPLSVKVFDFALPETFSYRTAFCIMDGWLFDAYPDGDLNARRRQAWDILLDHRLNPDDISRTEMPRIEDLLHARDRGMNTFNILNIVPKPKHKRLWTAYAQLSAYTPELYKELEERLDPYVAELRKHDLTKYAYFYGFDERPDSYNKVISDVHQFLKKRYPEIPFMTTSNMYWDLRNDRSREDCYANDWFCPHTFRYDDELSAELRKKGHQVWWYTACTPVYPYANFAPLDFPFLDGRVLGWMSFQHRADGFLFWHVNLWSGSFRFDETTTYQPGFQISKSCAGTNGDGQYMYPGVDGPLPSIRLANIRDGSEDYDYLHMLGNEARPYCDKLAPKLDDFERKPGPWRQARREIARKLEQR